MHLGDHVDRKMGGNAEMMVKKGDFGMAVKLGTDLDGNEASLPQSAPIDFFPCLRYPVD